MMKMPPIFDKLQKLPAKTRASAFGGIVVALLAVFIWQVHIPKTDEIKKLEVEVKQLEAKITENDAKIRKLDELKAEVQTLREKLSVLTQQLPPESEVSGLLRQIQGLVNKAGLTLNLWKPGKRKADPKGLYEEIPISLKLLGGYHNVAMFYDSVSKLARIVNILNVKMSGAKIGISGLMEINIDCTAMTFAATESKPGGAAPAKPAAIRR